MNNPPAGRDRYPGRFFGDLQLRSALYPPGALKINAVAAGLSDARWRIGANLVQL